MAISPKKDVPPVSLPQKPESLPRAASLAGRTVSDENQLTNQTRVQKIVEIFRTFVLFVTQSASISFVQDSKKKEKTLKMRDCKQSMIESLGGKEVVLKTVSGISITAMHFSASKTRCTELKASVKPETCLDDSAISEAGPTVIICTGSNCSAFAPLAYEHVVRAYLARGLNVVLYDYPGVGASEGSFSVKNCYEAAETVFKYLRTEKKVDEHKIVVEGYSMGAAPASFLAAHHNDIHLILRCPVIRVSEIGVEIIREKIRGGSIYQNCFAPIIEKIAYFSLPFDVKQNIQRFTGHLAVMIPAQKDRYEEDLKTASRLAEKRSAEETIFTIRDALHRTMYFDSAKGGMEPAAVNLSKKLDEILEKFSITKRLS